MFFMFYILVFMMYISEVNNYSFNVKTRKFRNTADVENTLTITNKDVGRNTSSAFPTHKPMFQIITNLTKSRSPNLKSNIFDKMLSNEMLSIKQQIYDKEVTQRTATQTYNKISVPTPTLEVKQKWPVIEFLEKSNIEHDNYRYNDNLNTKTDFESQPKNHYYHMEKNDIKNNQSKVVEMRSLAQESSFHVNDGVYQNLCTCQKPGHYATCSHRCIESMKICTHTPNSTILHYSPYPAFYMPYQSYLISGVSESPHRNDYYHPYILNELKLPKKKKHRKTTTEYQDEDLYYDHNKLKENNKYYDYLENDKAIKKPRKNKKNNVLINIDYDVREEDKAETSTGRYESHEEKLFKNVIDDLHTYVKKCYCSSSTRNFALLPSFFIPLTLMHTFFSV